MTKSSPPELAKVKEVKKATKKITLKPRGLLGKLMLKALNLDRRSGNQNLLPIRLWERRSQNQRSRNQLTNSNL